MSKSRFDINLLRMAIIDRDYSAISRISADTSAAIMLEAIIDIWLSIYYKDIDTIDFIITLSGLLRNIGQINADDIANVAVKLFAAKKSGNQLAVSNKYSLTITDMYKILSDPAKCPPIHKEIYKRIISYIPADEQKKIIPIIFYFSQKSKTDFFNSISIFLADNRKSRLISEIPHYNKAINTHYNSLISELCRIYIKAIQNDRLSSYYNLVNIVYTYKLKVQNIGDRIHLLYHIFEIILDGNIDALPETESVSPRIKPETECVSSRIKPEPDTESVSSNEYKYLYILPNIDESMAKKRGMRTNLPIIEYKSIMLSYKKERDD